MNVNKALTYVGLSKKAGYLAVGTEFVRDAVRQGKALTVVLALDASENSKKRVKDSCAFYGKEMPIEFCTSEQLAHAVGKKGAVSAVAICDRGLSKALTEAINKE